MSEERPLISDDVELGPGVVVRPFANLYGCRIGAGSTIGTFVEIQRGAVVGERCKVSSHSFICEGVTIEDEVFVGHHVCFTNDRYPRAVTADGRRQESGDWLLERTLVESRASIGSGAVILPGVTVGEGATIAAGAVVTQSVAPGTTVAGNPARVVDKPEAN